MKNPYLAIALSAPLLFAGCHTYTTGVVSVDRSSAAIKGIEVTSFYDNPFFAHILYDYSAVENFDPSKLKVHLVHDPTAIDNDWLEDFDYDSLEDNHAWFMMTAASSASLPRWYKREAKIVSHDPGHLTIFSMDDIGTYVLSYED